MTDFDSLYGGYNYAQTDVFSLLSWGKNIKRENGFVYYVLLWCIVVCFEVLLACYAVPVLSCVSIVRIVHMLLQ